MKPRKYLIDEGAIQLLDAYLTSSVSEIQARLIRNVLLNGAMVANAEDIQIIERPAVPPVAVSNTEKTI